MSALEKVSGTTMMTTTTTTTTAGSVIQKALLMLIFTPAIIAAPEKGFVNTAGAFSTFFVTVMEIVSRKASSLFTPIAR